MHDDPRTLRLQPFMNAACMLLLLVLAGSAPAHAQLLRAFVSVSGLDTNPCTRSQPCRSFGAALAVTDPGGEVIPLDTGGYGPFTIDRSVAVSSPSGIHAAITATAGVAIDVQAGSGAEVVLRGLFLNSQGADTGISFASGDLLHVESCVLQGFTLDNLRVIREAESSQPAELVVVDTTFRHRAAAIGHGMLLYSTQDTGKIQATVFRSRFENNYSGIHVVGRVSLAASHSVFSANIAGVHVEGFSGVAGTAAAIYSSQLTNHYGSAIETLHGGGSSINVYLGKNTITGNVRGVDGGISTTVRSTQNNTIHGNTTADVSGTFVTYSPL